MTESVLQDRRLLAVDDEPDVLETLEEQLAEIPGLTLDKATDYESGYHLIRSWTYDLAVLDIMGVRGFDLLSAAVALGVPAVMLTAHALSAESLKKSLELGARAFIPKEKMHQIIPFLEDVLTLSHPTAWGKVFERLGGFFDAKFGHGWQRGEREFWDQVSSGSYQPEPTILRK